MPAHIASISTIHVEPVVTLSRLEQQTLLQAIESAVAVRDQQQFFRWAQGQLQALLPHAILVCMQFDSLDTLVRLECLHATVPGGADLKRLCDPADGLAIRIARHCRDGQRLPCMTDAAHAAAGAPLAGFHEELRAGGFDNVLLHGSGPLAGGATMFALFSLPARPGARQAYFLEMLLPHLHLALLRLAEQGRAGDGPGRSHALMARPLSAREAEILCWVREGKSNYEVGRILGISPLTVKNHLQRIYKTLGVSNRTHALSRCLSWRLLEESPAA